MDLADVGGNVKDGCDIASMGGTWMVFAYGFGGFRDYDGTFSFRPQRPPDAQALLRFPLTYRGQLLDVEINPDSTTYSLREGEGWSSGTKAKKSRSPGPTPPVVRRTLSPVEIAS